MTGQMYLYQLVFPLMNKVKSIFTQWDFSSPGHLANVNFIYGFSIFVMAKRLSERFPACCQSIHPSVCLYSIKNSIAAVDGKFLRIGMMTGSPSPNQAG
jgi:hypothetical protein